MSEGENKTKRKIFFTFIFIKLMFHILVEEFWDECPDISTYNIIPLTWRIYFKDLLFTLKPSTDSRKNVSRLGCH